MNRINQPDYEGQDRRKSQESNVYEQFPELLREGIKLRAIQVAQNVVGVVRTDATFRRRLKSVSSEKEKKRLMQKFTFQLVGLSLQH
ncbi:MAG: hypothetical protein Q8P27_00890 [Candidatus Peregrinibacteria bacterium]|nr:hypothetical protein [Candidatus Peregrinibacteria bacterium]